MIRVVHIERITSLPLILAKENHFFTKYGLTIHLKNVPEYKAIHALLDAGRVDFGELPIAYAFKDIRKRKSQSRMVVLAGYLSILPLYLYQKAKINLDTLAPSKLHRFCSIDEYSTEEIVTKLILNTKLTEKKYFETIEKPLSTFFEDSVVDNHLGVFGNPNIYPHLRRFNVDYDSFASTNFPNTASFGSGYFLKNFKEESINFQKAIEEAKKFLIESDDKTLEPILEDIHAKNYFPLYSLNDLRNYCFSLSTQKHITFSKTIPESVLEETISLFMDHFGAQGFQKKDIQEILTTYPMEDLQKGAGIQKYFQDRSKYIIKNPPLKKIHGSQYRKLFNEVYNLTLDIMAGNIGARLTPEEDEGLIAFIKKMMNIGLESLQSVSEKYKREILKLQNLISILEIKLDRSSINLQYSEENYRYLFEFSREMIIVVDTSTSKILDSNIQFRKRTGYSSSELSRMILEDLIQLPQDELSPTKQMKDVMLYLPDIKVNLKDLSQFEMDLAISSLTFSGRNCYQIQFSDTTLRKETEKLKNEFISNISHELRSPMTSIRGYFELFSSDKTLEFNDEHHQMMRAIDKNIKRLNFLVDNLLKLEDTSKDKESLSQEIFDPSTIIEEVVQIHGSLAIEKKLPIELHLEKGNYMKGIRFEFSQIVANLVTNAIKYTPKGKVEIYLSPISKEKLQFIVKDTGIGMDPNFQDKIYDRFFRIPTPENRRIGGTGLGLSITKSLVSKFKGEIILSTELNKGTEFKIILPRVVL